MRNTFLPLLICLIALLSWTGLSAQSLNITPNQLLFKTTNSLEPIRGRTGLTAFDSFLDLLQATQLQPLSSIPSNRWYKVDVGLAPDWESVKSSNLHFTGIDVIQPNYLNTLHLTPNDPWFTLQQMDLVSLPDAWNYTTGSSLIIVGIVDSGVLKDHPDLQDNLFHNTGEIPDNGIDDDNNGYIDDYCGWDFADAPEMADVGLGDFIDVDNDVTDENFHGTHVAGIIGASTNNGIGVAGVCWNVKFLPIRAGFRTTSGTGFLQDDDAAAAIIYAANMGCRVINMSWGDPNYSAIIADACQYAFERGTVLVASAGNDPGPYLSYPAKLSCVISVGAVDPYKNLAGFSSYGPELDLVAPGQTIYSTYQTEGAEIYKEMSGTSMSAPFVTAAAALLLSIQPYLNPDEVKAKILSSCDDRGTMGFDQYYGHGLLNVRRMIENLNPPLIELLNPADHLGFAEDFDITGSIDSPDFFRYSVMYTNKSSPSSLDWYDVEEHTNVPHFFTAPVHNGILAHFYIPDLLQEGQYLLRIQYESQTGAKYNFFRTIFIDRSPPLMNINSFQIFKRYDEQNVKFYAGALFDEPVVSQMEIYSGNLAPVYCNSVKTDSIQVWPIPNTIPPGPVSVRITAYNNSNLSYISPVLANVANLQYELVSSYGFTPRIIGTAKVPLGKTLDFDNDSNQEIVAMDLPTSGYGPVNIWQPTPTDYILKYSFGGSFWPLDIGNTNSTGQELLYLNLDTAKLLDTKTGSAFPDTLVWTENSISGGVISDYNNDGQKDVLLVKNLPQERVIQLYKRIGLTELSPKNTLHNLTSTYQRNMYVPTLFCENLDGDNYPDILTADTDGDIMIYEVLNATNAPMTWNTRLPVQNTYYLTTGDFDGNGTTDFFVGGYNKDNVDPNQTYWLFEGFRRNGDNSFISMGYIQFNGVLSQNAVQSMDIDNDGKKEIILALSPNLYILKYQNNAFVPIFHGSSFRTYQIAAWKDSANNPYFITNQKDAQDSLQAVEWSKQSVFTGPPTPANLVLAPLNERTIKLDWANTNAEYYRIYRKTAETAPALIAETPSTTYSDTTLVADMEYFYCVAGVVTSMMPQESIMTDWSSAIPSPQPHVTSVAMLAANELTILFDQRLSTASLNSNCFWVDHGIGNPLSVNRILHKHGVMMRFRNLFTDIGEPYTVRLRNVAGITNVPAVDSLVSFVFEPDYTPPMIEDVQVQKGNRSVKVYFSETIDPANATNPENYQLILPTNDSDNHVSAVQLNDNIVTLNFSARLRYSNQPYYLVVNNICDLAGNPIPPHRNVARLTLTEIKDLKHIVIYPNPIHKTASNYISFLNFPPGRKGELRIYTSSGDLLYKTGIGPFYTNNNTVTCQWDCTNQSGKKVSSGIYYYVVSMAGEVAKGKFAILN